MTIASREETAEIKRADLSPDVINVVKRPQREKIQATDMGRRPDLSALRDILPPFVKRNDPTLNRIYPGRTLANKDSLGIGPKNRIMIGRAVAYERSCLIAWLESQSRVIE